MLAPQFSEWLAYAHATVTEMTGCACDVDVAWPGYMGTGYPNSRVLLVGAIHHAKVLNASGVLSIVPAVKAWGASPRKKACDMEARDRSYLSVVEKAYLDAIPRWIRWTEPDGAIRIGAVWSNFEKILNTLGLSFEDVAFTNLAKCALPAGTKQGVETRRIRAHERAWPLAKLIDKIDPLYVIIAKDNKVVTPIVRIPTSDQRIIRRCSNLTFVSSGRRLSEWLPEDATRYDVLRRKTLPGVAAQGQLGG
jgi:hypothetical protein